MILESVTQTIREEISKLNQVLHLLEGGKTKVKGRRSTESPVEESQGSKEVTPSLFQIDFFPDGHSGIL